ncbi:MAG: helix-turn-helix domain-containing protein [Acidimicrobiales bacterium]|nr:helix-turn-helix domain-containing protein [Acidimicrobiales bacterium]
MDSASPQPDSGSLSPTEFASAVTAITSAFGDPTRRAIYLFAHERPEGVTAGETAAHFDLHANVARHHLDKLAAGGHVGIELAKPSGGVGRPSKRYRATRDQVQLEVAIRHDDILVSLLGRALALLPAEIAEEMAEEVGMEYGKALAAALDPSETHRSYQGALHAVADALSAHGFAARAEANDDEYQIVAQNCPFGDAVVEHPVICAVDRGIVRGMLALLHGPAGADTASSKPQGDDVCVTHVTL